MYVEVAEQKRWKLSPEEARHMLPAERKQQDDSTPIAAFYIKESGMQIEKLEVTQRREIKLKTGTKVQGHSQL